MHCSALSLMETQQALGSFGENIRHKLKTCSTFYFPDQTGDAVYHTGIQYLIAIIGADFQCKS